MNPPQKTNRHNRLLRIISAELFWVFVISAIVRAIYYSTLFATRQVDTASYINYHANILTGQTEALRTPVYPYFIKLIALFGTGNLINNVATAQIIISYLSIILFYKTARLILKKRWMVIAASLLNGVMLPVINFDKVIITESLSVSYIVLFMYLLAGYLHTPKISKAVILTLSVFIAIMLRPSFIYLVPLIASFWLFRLIMIRAERKVCLAGFGALVMAIILLVGYSYLNQRNFGFNGISVVTNNNQMTVMIRTGLCENGNDPQISNAIKNNFRQLHKKVVPKDSLINIMEKFDHERVHKFLLNCMVNQKGAYAAHIFGVTVSLQNENIFTNYATHKSTILAHKVDAIEYSVFHINFIFLYVFLSLCLVLLAVKWLKTKLVPWLNLFLWLIAIAQIAVAIIGGYDEYQRLIVAAIPALAILLFFCMDELCIVLKRSTPDKAPN
jgi:hypothetical protein